MMWFLLIPEKIKRWNIIVVVDVLVFIVVTRVVAVDPRNLSLKFFKIGSVTAEILMTLSSRWWWVGGGVKSFSCQTQLLLGWVQLWLSWGCDNLSVVSVSNSSYDVAIAGCFLHEENLVLSNLPLLSIVISHMVLHTGWSKKKGISEWCLLYYLSIFHPLCCITLPFQQLLSRIT